MKALKDLFDSQERESVRLVEELEQHMAARSHMQKEYDTADERCIELARELAGLRLAESPRAMPVEVELKKARFLRDNVKYRWTHKLDKLRRELEMLTTPVITDFHLAWLEKAKQISSRYKFQRLEKKHNPFNDRLAYTVTVKHNVAALDRAKVWIFEQIAAVRALNFSTLGAIKEKIAQCELEFHGIDTDSLEIAEVSESTAADMKPISPAVAAYRENLGNLNDRISQLERGK